MIARWSKFLLVVFFVVRWTNVSFDGQRRQAREIFSEQTAPLHFSTAYEAGVWMVCLCPSTRARQALKMRVVRVDETEQTEHDRF